MGNRRVAQSVLVVRPDGRRPLGKPVRGWEVNIILYPQEMG